MAFCHGKCDVEELMRQHAVFMFSHPQPVQTLTHGVCNSAGVSRVYFQRDSSVEVWDFTDLTFHSPGPAAVKPAAGSR